MFKKEIILLGLMAFVIASLDAKPVGTANTNATLNKKKAVLPKHSFKLSANNSSNTEINEASPPSTIENEIRWVDSHRKRNSGSSFQLSWQQNVGAKPVNIVPQYGEHLGNLNLQGIFSISPRWNLEFYLSGAFAAGTLASEILKSASVVNHFNALAEQDFKPQLGLGLNLTVADFSQRLGTYIELGKSAWGWFEVKLLTGLMYGISLQGSDYLHGREHLQIWTHGHRWFYARAELGLQQIMVLNPTKSVVFPLLYQAREGVMGRPHFLLGLGSSYIPRTQIELVLLQTGNDVITQSGGYLMLGVNTAYQL